MWRCEKSRGFLRQQSAADADMQDRVLKRRKRMKDEEQAEEERREERGCWGWGGGLKYLGVT